MFTSFTLKNFRFFRELQIEPLERVNLIAGKNNTGKTALLEAIFLHLGPNDPTLLLNLNVLRGIEQVNVGAQDIWGWFFFGRRIDETIELLGMRGEQNKQALHIRLEEPEGARLVPNEEPDRLPALPESLTIASSGQ